MVWRIHYQKHDRIIRNIPLFSALSDEATSLIESIIVKKQFHKDQVVQFEEETGNYMYIVYAGKVRVVKLNEDGREQIIAILKKNDYFGELSLPDGQNSPATIIAHEASTIGLLSKEDFEHHVFSDPAIRDAIIRLLCNQLRDSWAMIKILSFDNAEHRIMAVLERLGNIYGVRDNTGTIINIRLTHQQIASFASVARETATRVLNRLEKENAIRFSNGRNILLTKSFYDKLRLAHST